MALASFWQLLRPQTLQQQRALHLYVAEVQEVVTRVNTVFDEWNTLREVEPDNERLANAAAVNRWELMRLARQAEQFDAPRAVLGIQREVHNAVVGAARASQLLANGYRSHKSEAVCDGQALLVEVVADLHALLDQLQMR